MSSLEPGPSENSSLATGCVIPRAMPPAKVSGSDVSRPTSAAASAWMVKMTRLTVSSFDRSGVTSTPESPAMPAPSAQLTIVTRLTSMPSRLAPSGASATARIATPKARVRKKTPSATATATATSTTPTWSQANATNSRSMRSAGVVGKMLTYSRPAEVPARSSVRPCRPSSHPRVTTVRCRVPCTGRMVSRSITTPMAAPRRTARTTAMGVGSPIDTPRAETAKADAIPIAPCAKLNTPEVL